MKLIKGQRYNLDQLQFTGWTEGDRSGHDGYHLENYFLRDGEYLGPDCHGIEPVFEDSTPET